MVLGDNRNKCAASDFVCMSGSSAVADKFSSLEKQKISGVYGRMVK